MRRILYNQNLEKRSVPGQRSIEIDIPLPGIRFPIDKIDLIDFAIYLDKVLGHDRIAVGGYYYNHYVDLPDKTYTNKASLEEVLLVKENTPGKNFFGGKNKIVGINLLTTREEIEKLYYNEPTGRQADEEVKKGDEYFREIDRKLKTLDEEGRKQEQERKRLHQEQYRQELEEIEQESKEKGERFQAFSLQLEQEDFEKSDYEDTLREKQQNEKELEEAAVRDALDKPNI